MLIDLKTRVKNVDDDVAGIFRQALVLGTDMPCAVKFTGDGYAYFPGNTASHGRAGQV